jgi:hypothetical protein
MSRVKRAWRAGDGDQHLAALASLALLVTMFLPWYGLQSIDRRTGVLYSHDISAFGDVTFVEAAVFVVAAGVLAMLFARVEGRAFRLPGGDGTIVALAGGWAALLIFYRVFDRPAGGGYPVGIEWGVLLAFVAAGSLAYAGVRMRTHARPEPPLRRPRGERVADRAQLAPDSDSTSVLGPAQPLGARPAHMRAAASARAAAPPGAPAPPARQEGARRSRPRYPPAPGEQLSFEDSSTGQR